MRPTILAFIAIAGIALLVVSGCASQSYVQKRIGELERQTEANRAEIAMLKSSDAGQIKKLSELSNTIQDAITRVEQMREITEGKFLYETTIHDDSVVFGFGSSELSKDTQIALDGFAVRLKEANRSCYIEIQGHTDNLGPESYNFHLGLARARAVMSYLYTQHGIPLNRMNTYSYGATKPIADNSKSSERAKNRRVSLVVMTQGTPSANAQSDKARATEGEYLEQENAAGDSHAAQSLTSTSPENGLLIQVGAYQSMDTAEKIMKSLKGKGYEAYLDKRTLPDLGLVYRVRISGYLNNVAAEADMERIKKEYRLSPILLNTEAA